MFFNLKNCKLQFERLERCQVFVAFGTGIISIWIVLQLLHELISNFHEELPVFFQSYTAMISRYDSS